MASPYEASRSHSDAPQSVGFLWTSDQPYAKTYTWQHTTVTRDRLQCPHAGFENTIPTSELPQTHALDRTATRIGNSIYRSINLVFLIGLFPHIGLIPFSNEHKLNFSIIAFSCLLSCYKHAVCTASVRERWISCSICSRLQWLTKITNFNETT